MKENEILVNEELNDEIGAVEDQEYYDEDVSGGGLFGKILFGGATLAAALVAGWYVTHKEEYDKRKTEKQIARLESKGFMVVPADEVVAVKEVEEDDVDVEETE